MNKYICGVPQKECSGLFFRTSKGLEARVTRVHNSSVEAFKCHAQYLKKTGHVQIGSREFLCPEGGIQVLTKQSRFGGRLRQGKGGEGVNVGNRVMPEHKLICSY